MTIRSVTVRYAADVGSLIGDLDKASKANRKLAQDAGKAGKSLDDVGQSADKSADRVDKLAKVGAGIAVGIGFAIAKFAEFDAQMSAVAAATGATQVELGQLRDAAIKAGADTQFSATEAAKGITELAKAGVSANDILGGGLTGALTLAAAGQLEVGDAAEIAATAMTQFNLEGNKVTHIADLLAAGAGKAQGGVGDLGFALKQSGLVAHQTGLSIEETTAGLTAFASAGLIGSDAGTSFKSMLQRLTPQSAQAAELMKELGISAYDSQGSFIGLAKFAGNLKDSLKNLTPEQRNSALATIFGSDAVRAAAVLYNQGAEGIDKWTKAVNQQGFAAQQAARLTDNLKGDIERLGGSLDTVLIQSGSGANSTLRTLTQTLEHTINLIGQIPGPVLTGAAAFGALALVGPKIAALGKTLAGPFTAALTRFREEAALQRALAPTVGAGYQQMGEDAEKGATRMQRAAGGVTAANRALKISAGGVIGILGGPWGIALTAATIGVTAFATAQANAEQAGQEFADTLNEQTGALTELSRSFVGKKLTADISAEDLKALTDFGINLSDVTDKILEGGAPRQALIAQLRDMAGAADGPNAALSALASTVEHTGNDVDKGRLKWEAYHGAVDQSAGSAAGADRQIADLGGSVDSYSQSATDAKGPTDDMVGSLGDIQQNADDATTSLKDLEDAVDSLGGGQRALRAAQRDLAKDFRDLTTAGKQQKGGTKSQVELQEEYQAALDQTAGDIGKLLQKQMDERVSVGTLKNTYDTQRDALEKQLKVRGLHGKALDEEADKILGTRDDFNLLLAEYAKNPEVVATNITTPGLEESQTKVEGYWEVINGVPTFVKTTATAYTSDAIKNINGVGTALTSLNGRVAYVTVRTNYVATGKGPQAGNINPKLLIPIPSAAGNILEYAGGGMDVANAHIPEISGPGPIRVWSEPETQGESYIPHADDWRRPRAKAILEQTAAKFGGSVQWNASGSMSGGLRWFGIDYRRMAAEFARIQQPNIHVVSGEDAKTATRIGINEFVYARDNE